MTDAANEKEELLAMFDQVFGFADDPNMKEIVDTPSTITASVGDWMLLCKEILLRIDTASELDDRARELLVRMTEANMEALIRAFPEG